MPALVADVFNLIAWGDQVRREGDKEWTESDLNLDGRLFTFRFVGNYQKIDKRSYEGRSVQAATVLVHDVRPDEVDTVIEILDDICWLLSLGHCSQVAAPAFRWEPGNLIRGRSTNATYHHFRPTIAPADARALLRLVEATWPQFQVLKTRRTLPVAIDYYVRSQAIGRTRELGLILVFVLLEHLKHSLAVDKGFVRRRLWWIDTSTNPETKHNFKSLLKVMFQEAGMPQSDASLTDVTTLRNEIIHSGLSAMPGQEQERIFDLSQNLCREYLLRILGYTGLYQPYVGGDGIAQI